MMVFGSLTYDFTLWDKINFLFQIIERQAHTGSMITPAKPVNESAEIILVLEGVVNDYSMSLQ